MAREQSFELESLQWSRPATSLQRSRTNSISCLSKRLTHRRLWLICSLSVCLLIVLSAYYFGQRSDVDPFNARIHNGALHLASPSQSQSPETSRPRIELHPEKHAYRKPLTQHQEWRVTSDNLRPDGVQKRVLVVNGLFPGPTVEARSGDTLIISVTNALENDSISIHWHGLHTHFSMDGAPGVTQHDISPGDTFTYNITIPLDQSGTFWYHSHSGTTRADGLYGGFIVHAPASNSKVRGLLAPTDFADSDRYGYEKELLLLIGDWYHRPSRDALAWYLRSGSFGNEPVPDSLLINGDGHFNCSMAVPARPVDCVAVRANSSYLDLDRRATYRVRVVNTGSLAGFTLVFGHEQLELIQLDGVEVESQQQQGVNSVGILFPGQRMDFVLRSPSDMDQRPSSLTVQLDEDGFSYPNPALTPSQTFPITPIANAGYTERTAITKKPEEMPTQNHLDTNTIPSSKSIISNIPPTAQQTYVVYTKTQKLAINHNIPSSFFNRTSWRPQQEPPVPLTDLPRQEWDRNQFSFPTGPEPAWVDLVVNNLDEGSHPFHLHGHHFYVLTTQQASIGWGSYNPFDPNQPNPPSFNSDSDSEQTIAHANNPHNDNTTSPYDLTKATLRDTTQIPSRGYAVLRFRADNPGVWLFHCHIIWHLANGMAMLVDVMR